MLPPSRRPAFLRRAWQSVRYIAAPVSRAPAFHPHPCTASHGDPSEGGSWPNARRRVHWRQHLLHVRHATNSQSSLYLFRARPLMPPSTSQYLWRRMSSDVSVLPVIQGQNRSQGASCTGEGILFRTCRRFVDMVIGWAALVSSLRVPSMKLPAKRERTGSWGVSAKLS